MKNGEKNHSPCVINLGSLEGFGTHWVCCWFSKNHFEYFDFFRTSSFFGMGRKHKKVVSKDENVSKKQFPDSRLFLVLNVDITVFVS